jgi:predicted nucleotidyltransferase
VAARHETTAWHIEGLQLPKLGAIVPNMGTIGVGLSDALFTKTQQRVLGLLFGNPDRSYYANEIVRLAGSGIGAVQRELGKLASAGIIEVRRVGNQKHYQANRQSPIFDELRGIAVKTFGIADVLRSFLEPFTERILAALIYGSVAKESDTAGSDIDLMIVSSDLSYADLFTVLSEAEDKLGRSVKPTVYKPAEFQRKLKGDNAFLQRVMEQPVIYLIGSQDDLERTRKPHKDR